MATGFVISLIQTAIVARNDLEKEVSVFCVTHMNVILLQIRAQNRTDLTYGNELRVNYIFK